MKKKVLLILTVLSMGICVTACGQADDSGAGVVISEHAKEWCKNHDVAPEDFGVTWLQQQTWDTEKKELKLTIDYPVDVANAYELFDDYYEWVTEKDLETAPEQVLNDEILMRGFGWGVGLKSWQFDGSGPIKYYNDILNINFSNFADPGPEENIISVREAYEKGWYYFAIGPGAIGLSNDYLFAQDRDTIRQYLDEIIDTCGSPDYIYASNIYDTVADMTEFASIGIDGENYSKSRVVNTIYYGLVYEYDEYVLYVDIVQEDVGYDTREGTIEMMCRPTLFLYTYDYWNAYQEKTWNWSLHPVK
ncbi:MAG: hypothetical protein K2O34_10535 [Acetatifactor sp.]|nr:hypothetical protein [Acetatifactor sp.]